MTNLFLPLIDCAALLLAGGQGRRMGQPKALLRLTEIPLIESTFLLRDSLVTEANRMLGANLAQYHLRHLAQVSNPVFLAAGPYVSSFLSTEDQPSHCLSSFIPVPDALAEQQGPLTALLSGLEYATKHGKTFLLVWSCDSLLPATTLFVFLQQMHAKLMDNVSLQACYFSCEDSAYPLLGLYRTTVAPLLRLSLQQGNRRVMHFIDNLHTASLTLDAQYQRYLNLNTPADLVPRTVNNKV